MHGLARTSLLVSSALATTFCTPWRQDPPADAATETAVDAGRRCDPSAQFNPPTPVLGLSDGQAQVGGLRLSRDELTGYFYATGGPPYNSVFGLYTATRDSQTSVFRDVMPIPAIGSDAPNQQVFPTVSGDGLTLIFARLTGNPTTSKQLFFATRTIDIPFGSAKPLPGDFSSTSNDAAPFLRDDGQVLYFASERDAQLGAAIYKAALTDGTFAMAQQIGANINIDKAVEFSPVITPNDLTMYYASTRTDGDALGGYDVWVVTRPSDEPFSLQTPMNVPRVNSVADDLPTFVSPDGCNLYLQSTRVGGQYAMFVATREQADQ